MKLAIAAVRRQAIAVVEKWEARLAREGLGDLDCGGRLSNRGSGTPKSPDTLVHREERAQDIERRRAVNCGMTRTQRRVWRLHAEGFGYRQIAARLKLSPHTARQAIAAVRQAIAVVDAGEAGEPGDPAPPLKTLVGQSDSAVLARLLLVLG